MTAKPRPAACDDNTALAVHAEPILPGSPAGAPRIHAIVGPSSGHRRAIAGATLRCS